MLSRGQPLFAGVDALFSCTHQANCLPQTPHHAASTMAPHDRMAAGSPHSSAQQGEQFQAELLMTLTCKPHKYSEQQKHTAPAIRGGPPLPLTSTGWKMRSTASTTRMPVTSQVLSTDARAPSTSTRWYLR